MSGAPGNGASGTGAPREWVTFTDPEDPAHEIRADLSWLLSGWHCIFGQGCRGIEGRPEEGCCSHGAFFSDRDDERRTKAAAAELTAEDWQRHGTAKIVQRDTLDGEPARRTRTVDGACVFLNRPDFPGGAGCALHRLALRTGRHPLETKPDVCWQLPLSRAVEETDDGGRRTVITEFARTSWGEGGADLHWWCTEAVSAHGSRQPVYRSYRGELTALLGEPAYLELARLCARRQAGSRPLLPLLAT
jgi:hypothetical protein